MGAYKKLNKQDAYITTHTAHKSWAVDSSDYATYGIVTQSIAGTYLNSVSQLYYPSKSLDGSGNIISHSFDYYNQSTLFNSASRNLITGSTIYSIPRDLYGVNIKPGTFFQLAFEISPTESINVVDDGEGCLYVQGSSPKEYVGDIIYSHGIAIVKNIPPTIVSESLTWQTSHPIFTHTYHCRIRESEFNHTYNPSALSSSLKTVYDNDGNIYSTTANYSNGEKNSNITGSEFQPYITTVGLYNDANQLIAVGKLAQPVPKSANTEMTITVKIDI